MLTINELPVIRNQDAPPFQKLLTFTNDFGSWVFLVPSYLGEAIVSLPLVDRTPDLPRLMAYIETTSKTLNFVAESLARIEEKISCPLPESIYFSASIPGVTPTPSAAPDLGWLLEIDSPVSGKIIFAVANQGETQFQIQSCTSNPQLYRLTITSLADASSAEIYTQRSPEGATSFTAYPDPGAYLLGHADDSLLTNPVLQHLLKQVVEG